MDQTIATIATKKDLVTQMGQVSVYKETFVGKIFLMITTSWMDDKEDMFCPGRNVEKPKRVERMLELPASAFTILANMASQVDKMDEEVF